MTMKGSKHAVYDIKYHFVWIPKYRKQILTKELKKRVEELFREIAGQYEFEIDTMGIEVDHVHIFVSAPPKYSPAKIVEVLKSISAKVVFQEFPGLRKHLWAGEFWSDGYFVRTVGDKVTSELIRQYIRYQDREHSRQLKLF
ncbi:MAG: transposase [Deltaproteobacteria bacterium RBG_16_47_11]|nr:MAG: transposase [Deltaproteobacteria bacterium RBG_16_47_11]